MAFSLMPDIGPPIQISEMGDSFNQSGIYFLWQADTVVYVGQSKRMSHRILQHACDRMKQFDGVSCKPLERRYLIAKERFYIEALLPKYNRCNVSESIRKTWAGHLEKRPLPDGKISPDGAARILGVTRDQLRALSFQGLEEYSKRRPRGRGRVKWYSVRDLHQFSAQKADLIIALRKNTQEPA